MIRFDNVSFHYAGEHGTGEGIDAIDLTVSTGEMVVLCGRSGCGKTTLTRTVNGLAPHFFEGVMEGSVSIDGLNVSTSALADISQRVGSIFQNPKSQFFNIDTTGELAFGCENQRMPPERIRQRMDAAVRELELAPLMDRSIFELSGGEKQQIACGSAYAADPDVLVLDEPSSNLDKKAIWRLRASLERLKRAGKTIVISEHRLYYLMELADRFVYMVDGRIERILGRDEMLKLDDGELRRMGLRATSLAKVTVPIGPWRGEPAEHANGSNRWAVEGMDLSCNRGSTQILDIERLELPRRSVIALIGDNGSGKSTLAETLCGVNEAATGQVAIDGTYLSDQSRAKKSFMVMQDVNHQLFCESVLDEVTLGGASAERARAVLERLGLEGLEERHPASLSGGQKQRVAIASALLASKRVMFYDEPTSGLDRDGMERFAALVHEIRNDSDVSIVITHDLELVLACCTHVLHIEDGRVRAFYPLDETGIERARRYFLSPSSSSSSKRRTHEGPFTKILSYAGEWKSRVWASVAVMLAAVTARMAPYLIVFRVLSAWFSGEALDVAHIALAAGGVLVCEGAYAVLYLGGLMLSHTAAFHTLENIRASLKRALDAQPVNTVRSMGTGAVKKLFSEDVESLEVLLAHAIPEGIANIAVPAAALLVMLAVDWQLALCCALMVLFGFLASSQMYATGLENMGTYYASTKRLNNAIIEYADGMEVVKVFNRDGEATEKLGRMVREYRDYALHWYKTCWPWMSAYTSIFAHVTLYALPLGALLVVTGALDLASYVLALCLSFGLGPMLLHGISFVSAIPQANYKIQSLEKAVSRPPLQTGDETLDAGACDAGVDVHLERVSLSYGDTEALRDVNLAFPAGSFNALVGASGSGKSSAAQLVSHLSDVDEGRVTLGGSDIRTLAPDAVARTVGYASQRPHLVNASVADNIRLGRPEASDAEVREAARLACCTDFIEQLPQGIDTPVGAGGAKLSGGERQRVALARALIKHAPVLVLDEATSMLDADTERAIMANVATMARRSNTTVIAIAHRLRTVQDADCIHVIDEGRVEASGTHEELYTTCPRYRALWEASERSGRWTLGEKGGDGPCSL